jgi:hypothetical protein
MEADASDARFPADVGGRREGSQLYRLGFQKGFKARHPAPV